MNDYKKELEVAVSIAREAGVIMLQYFDGDQQVEQKADDSPVTIADKTINSLVIKRLGEVFPEDGVIGEEESTTEYGSGRKWFCDPIDGTAGFIQGIPTAMFSLALVVDGKPMMGVAYDPFLNRMYTGNVGAKSFCNDKEISASTLDFKTGGTFALSSSIKRFVDHAYLHQMIKDNLRLVCVGGAVFKSCLIARGKLVGYFDQGVNAHDVAAVQVIVQGAGGKVTALDGTPLDYTKPFKGGIVSNGVVHDKLVEYASQN